MSIFTLKEIEAAKGEIKFFKLLKNGKCDFNKFISEAKENNESEVSSLFNILDRLSRGKRLPAQKHKPLKGIDEKVFELKTKHLRLYYFIEKVTGNVVVLGGYKKNQKKDINKLIIRLKEYKFSKSD